MKTKKRIGILAGMGPRSTSPFLERVYDECQLQYGAKADIDYPEILIYSLPTPFYVDQELDHAEMERTILEGLKRLESWDVDFIAMPCNSAHVYFSTFRKGLRIPLLNIVEETVKQLPEGVKRVTVFGTESTRKAKLYEIGLKEAGIEYFFCPEWQEEINRIIKGIKEKSSLSELQERWNILLRKAAAERIDGIVSACTDLSVLYEEGENRLPIFDSAEALAKATIKNFLME